MKKHKMPDMKEGNVNVTPLIDIVMCLIIFYMLVAKIGVNTGQARNIDPPTSGVGTQIKDIGNTITLNVSTVGNTDNASVSALDPTDGKMKDFVIKLAVNNGQEDSGRKNLEAFLKRLRGKNTEFKVIIYAAKDLNYKYVEPVLLLCNLAQVKDYNFVAKKATEVVPG